MALVVVGAPLDVAGRGAAPRLRTVERLDLCTFHVDTQHHGAGRWIEVEPTISTDLADEVRVGGEVEGLGAVRLEPEGVPDALDAVWGGRGVWRSGANFMRGRPRACVPGIEHQGPST